MKFVRDAVRRHSQEIAVCCVANHNATMRLTKLVQPMLAEHQIQQVGQSQISTQTLYASFYCFYTER
jgi:hypothetical protein